MAPPSAPGLAGPLPWRTQLDHTPSAADGLPLIQTSALALDAAEVDRLHRDGVVLSERRRFPNFVEGYVALYAADLPLFVSADSILHALHRTYEDFLASIEADVLAPALDAMLVALRDNLAAVATRGADARACGDVATLLEVALRLLRTRTGYDGVSEVTGPVRFVDAPGGASWTDARPRRPQAPTFVARAAGTVVFEHVVPTATPEGHVVLGRAGVLRIVDDAGQEVDRHAVPHGVWLRTTDGTRVAAGDLLAEGEVGHDRVLAEFIGRVRYEGGAAPGARIEEVDEITGLTVRRVPEDPEAAREAAVSIVALRGGTAPGDSPALRARTPLPPGTRLVADDGQAVRPGTLLATVPDADQRAYLAALRQAEPRVDGGAAGAPPATEPEQGAVAPTDEAERILEEIAAGGGVRRLTLFGADREMDFSQLAPIGDFQRYPARAGYFRALRWLGAACLHLVSEGPDGAPVLQRRQLAAARLLCAIFTGDARAQWDRITAILRAWVGDFDDVTVSDLEPVFARHPDDADPALTAELMALARAHEQIEGDPITDETLPRPLARARLFGRVFTADAWVMHRLVFDRVGGGRVDRTLPDPLDVAYAALGNDHAAALLAEELARYPYAADLAAARAACETRATSGAAPASLYDGWLDMLRALSPRVDDLADPGAGLADTARTEAWGRRVLNTQLASWAELRHATALYAKQSRTWGIICSFPDVFVEPYPAFFAAVRRWALTARETTRWIDATAPTLAAEMRAYFGRLLETADVLGEMAARQRAGLPLTEAHLRFANQAVTLRPRDSCAPLEADGWFPMLYREADAGTVPGLPVVDVHTDDAPRRDGSRPGAVLHVGTGAPRLLVVTVATPRGPRAYAGLASSFYAFTTTDYERLDDVAWSALQTSGAVTPPPWLAAVCPMPSTDPAPVVGEVHTVARREDGFCLVLAPGERAPYLPDMYELDRDARAPGGGVVLARRGECLRQAWDTLRAASVHELPLAAWRLLGVTLRDDVRDADGLVLAERASRVTPEVLAQLARASGAFRVVI